MSKKLFKKYIPDPEKLKQYKALRFLGDRLHKPDLWHLNRRCVSLAFAVGLFVAWIPVPGQMPIAAVVALYVRANLPISIALVWTTNPLTMPPMFYFAYYVGLLLLGRDDTSYADFNFNLQDIIFSLGNIGAPFLLGCLFLGIISALLGYCGIRLYWRYCINKKWHLRNKNTH